MVMAVILTRIECKFIPPIIQRWVDWSIVWGEKVQSTEFR